MKFAIVALTVVGLGASSGAEATVTVNTGPYTLTYDETTPGFGSLQSWSSGPGDAVSFQWALNPVIQVSSSGGATVTNVFALPDFTITANPGYVLFGDVTRRIGNLTFVESGAGASTSIQADGTAFVDSDPAAPLAATLPKVYTLNSAAGRLGYFDGSFSYATGGFNSIEFVGAHLTLTASGGRRAAINPQPQNVLAISFFAQAVPEPETYAMYLAGLGVIAWLLKRRRP